ncbi:HNH endonuclease [Elizabethkingia occulta]|uniref:HNH endonuclease n=1 Tax=Elizabethkingia occulta TaxID=1867263 RepID=UPI00398C6E4E
MWKRIPKEVATPPTTGGYSDWKPNLSVEGFHQCVYCFVNESYFGGIRNFHVEHYRPKKKFEALTNVYSNLFYACSICNSFKSDDWPNEPNFEYNISFYPDPSIVDYSEIFEIDMVTFYVKGKNVTTEYIVNKLFLNRKQLVIYRKTNFVKDKYTLEIERSKRFKEILFKKISAESDIHNCISYLRRYENILPNLETVYRKKESTIPYTREDITKT